MQRVAAAPADIIALSATIVDVAGRPKSHLRADSGACHVRDARGWP